MSNISLVFHIIVLGLHHGTWAEVLQHPQENAKFLHFVWILQEVKIKIETPTPQKKEKKKIKNQPN